MARVLIVGGGCRGRVLAGELLAAGHAVRITTRSEAGRAAIEATGAQCHIGTPDRTGTLRSALDAVSVACWMLGTARGDAEALSALHGTRLDYWLTQVIDTTVRGFVYEAAGTVPAAALAERARRVRAACALNSIPLAIVHADPADTSAWVTAAAAAVAAFLVAG